MNAVDEGTFVIALEESQFGAGKALVQSGFNVFEAQTAVERIVSFAQAVQVGTVDDEQLAFHDCSSSSSISSASRAH